MNEIRDARHVVALLNVRVRARRTPERIEHVGALAFEFDPHDESHRLSHRDLINHRDIGDDDARLAQALQPPLHRRRRQTDIGADNLRRQSRIALHALKNAAIEIVENKGLGHPAR